MAFAMGKKLFTGNRDEKVEAATSLVMWMAAVSFTLSTAVYYAQPFISEAFAHYLTDDTAVVVGAALGVCGSLKFSA